jgi:hypothetical protein
MHDKNQSAGLGLLDEIFEMVKLSGKLLHCLQANLAICRC